MLSKLDHCMNYLVHDAYIILTPCVGIYSVDCWTCTGFIIPQCCSWEPQFSLGLKDRNTNYTATVSTN